MCRDHHVIILYKTYSRNKKHCKHSYHLTTVPLTILITLISKSTFTSINCRSVFKIYLKSLFKLQEYSEPDENIKRAALDVC